MPGPMEVFSIMSILKGSMAQKTILLVDDETIIRELMSDVISAQGYEVIHAPDGKQAVDAFRTRAGRIDLVILDMHMPEMDGKQTFEALKSISPDVKVLVSSGFSDDVEVRALLSKGAMGIVNKPFRIDDLLRLIKNTIGS